MMTEVGRVVDSFRNLMLDYNTDMLYTLLSCSIVGRTEDQIEEIRLISVNFVSAIFMTNAKKKS